MQYRVLTYVLDNRHDVLFCFLKVCCGLRVSSMDNWLLRLQTDDPSLDVLELCGADLDAAAGVFGAALRDNTALRGLTFATLSLDGVDRVLELAEALKENRGVTSLSLNDNFLGAKKDANQGRVALSFDELWDGGGEPDYNPVALQCGEVGAEVLAGVQFLILSMCRGREPLRRH
jgi:hypothetical protein